MTSRTLLAGLLTTAFLAGCSLLGTDEDAARSTDDVADLNPEVSMTKAGAGLAEDAGLADRAPSYDVTAAVEPTTGAVRGTVRAILPVGPDVTVARLRYFAGLPDFDAGAALGEVRLDGETVETTREASLVEVALPPGHGDRVELVLPFSYELPESEEGGGLLGALGGMGGPADVGLLARRPAAMNLGHWFPLWIPEGNSAEPNPAGFGDIGNFPAAIVRMDLTAPRGWTVVDGGVRTGRTVTGERVRVTSEGYGMNDLVVTLLRGYSKRRLALDGELEGVTVTAYAPRSAAGHLNGVLAETATSLRVLSEHFVAYPWREFDVVSAPLGAGVGGMEWPGATWIEPGLFAGGIPGLGGLEGVLGGSGMGLEGLEGLEGLGGLEELLGGVTAGGLGETGRMIETLRAWTIAHEVGHEWWHVLVGNDSVLDPVVDEPLAQYSACLVLRDLVERDPDALCDVHVATAYEQMRLLGDDDGPAARATDEFDSSSQYAGLVYGKAAAFYRELERVFGADAVVAALRAVTERHAFAMLTAEDLRSALAAEVDDPARLDRLWRRWMERRHGDRDLGVSGTGPDLGGLDALLEGFLGSLEDRR